MIVGRYPAALNMGCVDHMKNAAADQGAADFHFQTHGHHARWHVVGAPRYLRTDLFTILTRKLILICNVSAASHQPEKGHDNPACISWR